MAFAENLKEYRNKTGISQAELAKEMNVSLRTITNYESGIKYPPSDLLWRMAKFFDVSMDEFMNEKDEFLVLAYERGGSKGKREAEQIIAEVAGLFAGGELTDKDKDAAMRFITDAYFTAKEENKKYTPRKHRKNKSTTTTE